MIDDETRVDTDALAIPNVAPRTASLVQIYGKGAPRRLPLEGDVLTLGRGDTNDVMLDHDNVSRFHAEVLNKKDHYAIVDKGSTNGTFVNDRRVKKEHLLNSGDLVKIGGSIFKFISGTDIEGLYFEEIYRMTIIDGLTEIHNKRYLLEFLEREMARCARYKRPMSLIMFDVDHFKKINDTHGHIAGDYVLKRLASLVNEKIRREELFARYGGEEFTVVMPESGAEQAATFAEKVRELIQTAEFNFDTMKIDVTVSLGVGEMQQGHQTPLDFIQYADHALYAAKRNGRNRVEIASAFP
ncbi:MAG: GGDEF domain-containing protein [Deltaproteobacteria bacterium]|nr:GGDEF domain-containing protein [Deltaproteobacteria bacterium]